MTYEPSWFRARIRPARRDEAAAETEWMLGEWVVELDYGGDAELARSLDGRVTLLVHGYVLGQSAASVLAAYLKRGDSFALSLSGSFALVIVDQSRSELLVVTDRVGSKAVLSAEVSGTTFIGSSSRLIPTSELPLDPAGIASALINGLPVIELTLFSGMVSLRQASVHSFRSGRRSTANYWNYMVGDEDGPAPDPRELARMLRQVVHEWLGDRPVMISLSGGYDSRSIAALTAEVVDPGQVTAITYFHGHETADSDMFDAEPAATALGFRHELIDAYHGDVLDVLRQNARKGEGLAQFCDEIVAWEEIRPLADSLDPQWLLNGDHFFLYFRRPAMESTEKVINSHGIHRAARIGWFLSSLPPEARDDLSQSWDESFDELVRRVSPRMAVDHRYARRYMYLTERLPHRLGRWRERFQSDLARTASPYLDSRLLDYAGTTPIGTFEAGRLYYSALEVALPGFKNWVPAGGGWARPDWGTEIAGAAADIVEVVAAEPSRIDAVVPPDLVVYLVRKLARSRQLRARSGWPLVSSVRRGVRHSAKARSVVRSLRKRRDPTKAPDVDLATLVRRLLVLRMALSADELPSEVGHQVR